jgi:hypothetical protein
MDASLTAPNQLKAYRSVDRHGIKELRELILPFPYFGKSQIRTTYYFVARLTLSKQAKQNVEQIEGIQVLYYYVLFRLF